MQSAAALRPLLPPGPHASRPLQAFKGLKSIVMSTLFGLLSPEGSSPLLAALRYPIIDPTRPPAPAPAVRVHLCGGGGSGKGGRGAGGEVVWEALLAPELIMWDCACCGFCAASVGWKAGRNWAISR